MAITMKLFDATRNMALDKAVQMLNKGGTVIFPTESSYGLGADAKKPNAIRKIFSIKQQPPTKQVSIIVDSLEQAEKFGKLNEDAKKLAAEFMPGPLTLVVEKQYSVPNELSEKTIAFRISSHPIARELCKRFGSAITATSANRHNSPSIYSGKEIVKQFHNKVDMIIDAGELSHNAPSTIFDIATKQILRRGAIPEDMIRKVLED